MKKLIFLCVVLFGCHAKYYPVVQQVVLLNVSSESNPNAEADSLIEPYRKALRGVMDESIIFNPYLLQKQQPESALGNLLADMVLEAGRKEFGEVDIAMLNYGGIRAALPADTLRIGHILEMLPFNNLLQLVELDSALLHVFFTHWVEKGGTPFAGVRIKASGKVLNEVLVGGEKLTAQRNYRLVMPDYVANGGDGCGFLSGAIKQQQGTRLLSDVIINALKSTAKVQPQLNVQVDGRFVIE